MHGASRTPVSASYGGVERHVFEVAGVRVRELKLLVFMRCTHSAKTQASAPALPLHPHAGGRAVSAQDGFFREACCHQGLPSLKPKAKSGPGNVVPVALHDVHAACLQVMARAQHLPGQLLHHIDSTCL